MDKKLIVVSDGTANISYVGYAEFDEDKPVFDEHGYMKLTDCRAIRSVMVASRQASMSVSDIVVPASFTSGPVEIRIKPTMYSIPSPGSVYEDNLLKAIEECKRLENMLRAEMAGIHLADVMLQKQ